MTAIYVLLYLRFFIIDNIVGETMVPAGNIIIWILFYFGLLLTAFIDKKLVTWENNK